MHLAEIRKKIMADDEFVLQEVKRIQYLYRLQTVIRYHLTRPEEIQTESVAEHIYGMIVLANYFSALEYPEGDLDIKRVYELISWHDIDEIETGDILGYLKTDKQRVEEESAKLLVIKNAPQILQAEIRSALAEYKEQITPEAKFVKAIDKLDPIFFVYNENGKRILALHKTTQQEHTRIKEPYLKEYPYMMRFLAVTTIAFKDKGFFSE